MLSPASGFIGYLQADPVFGTVSGNVKSISIEGRGAIQCSGSYGELIVFGTNGAELGRASLSLIDASDCSTQENPDNVTFGAQASVTTTETIARLEITPMSPLEFDVLGIHGGHASQTYTVTARVDDSVCELFADPAKRDPLMADPAVQAALEKLADQTNWNAPLHDQVERGGFLVSKDGVVSLVPYPAGLVPPNPCMSAYTSSYFNSLTADGGKIVAQIHTHPSFDGPVKDPGNCLMPGAEPKPLPAVPMRANAQGVIPLQAEPSRPDTFKWRNDIPPPGYPGYVLRPKKLYRFSNKKEGIDPVEFPINKCIGHQKATP